MLRNQVGQFTRSWNAVGARNAVGAASIAVVYDQPVADPDNNSPTKTALDAPSLSRYFFYRSFASFVDGTKLRSLLSLIERSNEKELSPR